MYDYPKVYASTSTRSVNDGAKLKSYILLFKERCKYNMRTNEFSFFLKDKNYKKYN